MKSLTKRIALFLAVLLSIQTLLVPLAWAETATVQSQPSRVNKAPDTPIDTFAKQVAALESALAEYESATDLTRQQSMERIRTLRAGIRNLNQAVKDLFARDDQKLRAAKAQGKVTDTALTRQQAALQQYLNGIALLERELTALENAGNDPVAAKGVAKRLRETMEQQVFRPEEKELGSGTLPFRTSDLGPVEPSLSDNLIPAYDYGRRASEEGIKGAAPGGSIAPTAADLQAGGEVAITPEIEDLAEMLRNDPVRIYEWVRNNISYEPYYGTVKGAMQTLREKGGNDADQAALLIALLRAAGIPARYVYGTVDIPSDQAANWLGVTDRGMAGSVLATGGIPVTALVGGGSVMAIRTEHVWVEAFVPYGSYRGAMGGEIGPVWVALDPSFKQYNELPGVNVLQGAGLDGIGLYDGLLQAAGLTGNEDRILSIDQDRVTELLTQRRNAAADYVQATNPGLRVEETYRRREIRQENIDLLPASLPYAVKAVLAEYASQPADKLQTMRVTGAGLSYQAPIYALAGKRVTLSYAPATAQDQAIIDSYGGLYKTPAYLIDVKPVLKVEGQIVAEGTALGMGYQHDLNLTFTQAGGRSDTVENVLTAGGMYAVVLNTQKVPERLINERQAKLKQALEAGAANTSDELLGETLYVSGLTYFYEVGRYSDYLAATGGITYSMQVSEGITAMDLRVSSIWGAPYQATPGSMYIDVDRNIVAPFALDGDRNKVLTFMFMSGMMGSSLEHAIWEQLFGVPSISAMKFLYEAANDEIPIFTITAANLAEILPQLQVSRSVKSAIQNAIATGRQVIIPQKASQLYEWQGVGYIVFDPATGSAGYMISGGLAGGSWLLDIDIENLPWIVQALLAFLNGLILGDFDWDGYDDGWLEAIRIAGQIVSGLVAIGDIRDALAAAKRIYDTGGADGKLALILSLIGIIPLIGDVIKGGKFAPDVIEAITKSTLKNIPAGSLDEAASALQRVLGDTYDEAIAGYNKLNINQVTDYGDTVLIDASRYGRDVDINLVSDGQRFVEDMGGVVGDASSANKGRIGENASDWWARQNDLNAHPDYRPPTEGQHGIDRIYTDANGNLVVVESKFTTSENNIGTNILGDTVNSGRQMSDQWIRNAITDAVANGSMTPQLAQQLTNALNSGTLQRQLVVVQSSLSQGQVPTQALLQNTGLTGVSIINIGPGLP